VFLPSFPFFQSLNDRVAGDYGLPPALILPLFSAYSLDAGRVEFYFCRPLLLWNYCIIYHAGLFIDLNLASRSPLSYLFAKHLLLSSFRAFLCRTKPRVLNPVSSLLCLVFSSLFVSLLESIPSQRLRAPLRLNFLSLFFRFLGVLFCWRECSGRVPSWLCCWHWLMGCARTSFRAVVVVTDFIGFLVLSPLSSRQPTFTFLRGMLSSTMCYQVSLDVRVCCTVFFSTLRRRVGCISFAVLCCFSMVLSSIFCGALACLRGA